MAILPHVSLHAVHTGAGCVIGVGEWAVVIFWLAAYSGPNLAVPMAHLLDCLLMRQSVKDQGGARHIDDVRIKPQLVFRVELSSYAHHTHLCREVLLLVD